MWNWINRNGQGLAALFSAFAVLGVVYQVWASDQAQRAQSARDIYREFVALTVNKPELAGFDWVASTDKNQKAAYEAYVEYLLYTSEQVIAADEDWREPMRNWLLDHAAFLCALEDADGYTPAVQALVGEIRNERCP
jgi:hypothetical protein